VIDVADNPQLLEHRRQGCPAAVVFVHGFGGSAAATWGRFPGLLAAEPLLQNWDIYSIGYSTSLAFDIAGLWSADPEIITLGGLIETIADVPPINRYGSLALVAHSMGGLLLQRALVSSRQLRSRVSHLMLFGTPSGGLEKASPFHFWKRQLRDMARDSAFIRSLRQEWSAEIGLTPPFTFVAAAGDRDEFVPRTSSLDPFAEASHRVIYGNHLEIVKPDDSNHLGLKLAIKTLTGMDAGVGPFDAALRAVESREFQRAIDTLGRHPDELDDKALVTLALALESVGRRNEAIDILTKARASGTDPLGVLAGRLKRRWLAERRRADAEEALALYRKALAQAEAKGDLAQAFYHAINCAFMELAYGSDATACRVWAERAVDLCQRSSSGDVWRYATEGEANLYLGNTAAARDAYLRALAMHPQPRQADSMYQQAVRAADLMGEDALVAELRTMFGQLPAAT
jgi:pimeloyl-ACP methyl ester carboxylesterase